MWAYICRRQGSAGNRVDSEVPPQADDADDAIRSLRIVNMSEFGDSTRADPYLMGGEIPPDQARETLKFLEPGIIT